MLHRKQINSANMAHLSVNRTDMKTIGESTSDEQTAVNVQL